MIAQDTGSAIIGPARADLYFGAGLDAGKVAGQLRHNARFVMLVPKSLDPVARGRMLPVPDDRPSEVIAKLFPQTAPVVKPTEVTATTSSQPTAQAVPPASTTGPARLRPFRHPRQRRCHCLSRGRRSKRFRPNRCSVNRDDIAIVDETPAIEFDP